MLVEELKDVSNEILLEHLTNYANNPETHVFEGNSHGTQIAQAFANTFEAFLQQDAQVHGLNLKAIPVTTPELLELVDRTFKTDPRTTKEINGMPAALNGINPLSEERSAMVMAIVGDIPDGNGNTKKELVGLRSLTYASEQDIKESYGFAWDEIGNFKELPYDTFVKEGQRVLMRGWTTLVPHAGGISIRGNGVGGVLGKATHATALELKHMAQELKGIDTLIMGEQMGFVPLNIGQELSKLTKENEVIDIKGVEFPLYELLGYENQWQALNEINAIFMFGAEADQITIKEKFGLLGVGFDQYEQCIELDYPVKKLIGNGNPNAKKMKQTAIEMGAEEIAFFCSCFSAGRWLTCGPVYVGEIKEEI